MYYIILILLTTIVFVFISYIINLKKVNNDIEILQTYNFEDSSIQNILVNKQPTIFKEIMYEWELINDIHELPIEQVQQLLEDKKFYDMLSEYLNQFSLFLSFNWNIKINKYTKGYKGIFFIKESNHRHLICQITGISKILLASPNQNEILKQNQIKDNTLEFNNIRSNTNFWNKEETHIEPFNKLEYIEIILKEASILYIPNEWWYIITTEEDGIIMETNNESFFNIF